MWLYYKDISDNVCIPPNVIFYFLQEPPCKICSRLTSPYAINSRTLKNLYNLPVRRRRECCEPSRSNAKVGTDLRSEFDSHFYNADPVVNKIQESRRNVQDLDCSKRDKVIIY